VQLVQALADLVTRNPVTALLVTHDIDEAINLADRVFLLSASPCRVIAEVPIARPRSKRSPDEIAALRDEIQRRRNQAGAG
jgi:ABC-type nitrate/sulfonate/bicarbonate transport system ATPase subunit